MRPRLKTRSVAAAAFAVLALAPGAAAQMQVAVKVFDDFRADGRIDPCKHSSEELRLVQKNIPPDIEQYAPDYPAAVAAALEARARGDCAGKKPVVALPTPNLPPVPTPIPTPVPTAIPTKTVVPDPPEPERPIAPAPTPVPRAQADVQLERVATARPANAAPAPVFLLAILAGLLASTALLLVCMRRFGWGDERLAPVRHAWREAGFRTGGAWDDFRDWLRLGR